MNHECLKQEIIQDMKKDIENLYNMKEVVIELRTLVNMQIQQSKKQDDLIKEQSDVLIRISDTVLQQGECLKRLNQNFDDLNSKFINEKYTELKENSISFNTLIREALSKWLPPIISAGIMYLILSIKK